MPPVLKRRILIFLAFVFLLASMATPAAAKSPPVTKMKFKLTSHDLLVGDTVSATITVQTREGNQWVPLPGVTLSLTVDKVDAGTVTADDTGLATITWVATAEGDHVMKVAYAGDDLHKKCQRAQGFTVSTA